ncbi:unnamed protein product [Meganyctiphanes norvegica]|uniref:Non-canonical purine NTP phosphatase/PRRC1 domain-containing protein n=1 Tax=Meganyctiphanes norvegica TaxID=48144 RepID=A0AAV2R271_MEGNR
MMQEDSNGDFEIVDRKMAGLLGPESNTGNSTSGTSVLTNVPPPSSLPAFYAAPPRPPAPGMSFSSGMPPPGPPPGAFPPAGMPMPPLGTIPPPMAPPVGAGVPPPGSNFTPPTVPPTLPPVAPPAGPPTMGPTVTPVAAPPTIPVTTPQVPLPSATPITSQPQTPQSPTGSVETSAVSLGSPTSLEPSGGGQGKGGSWMGWIKGTVSSVGTKVAEKAKNSMDTMITTLDPQMKEFIRSGGDMDIIVASDKEVKIGAVREAFQTAFGRATVNGIGGQASSVAAQPVGFEAALQAAEERINSLRSTGNIHPHHPIVALENFIVELTPECWYEMGLLLLDDPGQDILLQTYTQVTPIPPDYITQARCQTPDDYPLKASGFSTTIGQIASQHLQVHHSQWQEMLSGVPRRDMIVLASRTLAGLYKARLPHQ